VAAADRALSAEAVTSRREGLAWALLGVVMFSFSLPLTKVAAVSTLTSPQPRAR